MNWLEWLSLAGICLLGAMSPGPSLAVVVSQTLRGGAGRGTLAALAHGAGVALYAVAVVSGLAVIVTASDRLYGLIQWAGALFLIYLGVKSLRSRGTVSLDGAEEEAEAAGALIQGFSVAFLNPKLAVFFLALFSQFLTESVSLPQKVVMVATVGIIDAGWYTAVSLLLGRPKILERLRRSRGLIDRAFGIILIALAIRVVLPGQ